MTNFFGLPLLIAMSGWVPHFVSGGAPDWCRWVPMKSQEGVPECGGYVYPGSFTGYGCANWCHWVPDASWGNTYGCNECAGLYSGHTKSADKSGCQKGCQWVSRPCWRNTSDCNQCEQPMNSTKSMKTGRTVDDSWISNLDLQKILLPKKVIFVSFGMGNIPF